MLQRLSQVALACVVAILAFAHTEAFAQIRFIDRITGSTGSSIESRREAIRQAILAGIAQAAHGPKLKNHGPLPDSSQLVLPHWTSTFRTEGVDYPFTVIGADPRTNQTTVIPVVIIPYRFHFADGTVIDATTDLIDGATALDTVLASPIFNDYPFTSGTTALGITQWGDAYMRGNFWSLHGGASSDYHVRVQVVGVTPVVPIDVPADVGLSLTFGSETIGIIDFQAMQNLVANITAAFRVPPSVLSIHLAGDVMSITPAFGNALGFHDAADLSATTGVPGYNTYIQAGVFPKGSVTSTSVNANVAVLAHEVVEWLADPLGSNVAPLWLDPGINVCWNNLLEVADPLEFSPGKEVMFNGRSYTFPDVAFLPWFARVSSKYSVNGWFTLNNSQTSYSKMCPPFFQPYAVAYFANPPGIDSAQFTSINTRGQATGYFTSGGAVGSFVFGNLDFINPNPPPITVDTINVPGSVATIATKINDSGQIVGIWIDSQGREHGFLLNAGQYSSIDVPGAIATEALALDNKSNLTIAGDYVDSAGLVHGFTLTAGQFKRVDVPQASATAVSGINGSNQIVGRYQLPSGNTRGFIGNPGTMNSLDFPSDIQVFYTLPSAVNDAGHVVGSVLYPAVPLRPDISNGFLSDRGTFFPLQVFGFPTVLNDINSQDFIAGGFFIGSALVPASGSTPMILVPSNALPSGTAATQMIQWAVSDGAFAKH